MITRVENEIIELHQFFQDWYNNVLFPTDANFARCADVLSLGFSIIFPSGIQVPRRPLLEKLRAAHNSHTDMHIWIKNIKILHQGDDLILATYEEWQEIENEVTARLSSALFLKTETTTNRLAWLHVHETWIKT